MASYDDTASYVQSCLQGVVSELVKKALQSCDDNSVILVEGFPRTKDQLEEFNQWVGILCLILTHVRRSNSTHTHATFQWPFATLSWSNAGADAAIGGPGGRLPLWAALSEKTGFFRL